MPELLSEIEADGCRAIIDLEHGGRLARHDDMALALRWRTPHVVNDRHRPALLRHF